MSWRMAVAVRLSRWFVRPLLARASPELIAQFDNGPPVFLRSPGHVTHLVRRTAGAELHWIAVGRTAPRRVIFYVHGGAFVAGSPRGHGPMLARIARLSGVEVCAPHYRLAQVALFPAALDDVRAAWGALMSLGYRPEDVVLGCDSAGGALAFALLAERLAAGERPAGVFAFSPWVDMTLSGESLARFGPGDPLLPIERIAELRDLYLDGSDPANPAASPLFAEFPDPPPALIQVGAEEALLSDAERLADRLRAAGGEVTLDPWPGCLHVWQMTDGWVPEARAALRDVGRFVQRSFDMARR